MLTVGTYVSISLLAAAGQFSGDGGATTALDRLLLSQRTDSAAGDDDIVDLRKEADENKKKEAAKKATAMRGPALVLLGAGVAAIAAGSYMTFAMTTKEGYRETNLNNGLIGTMLATAGIISGWAGIYRLVMISKAEEAAKLQYSDGSTLPVPTFGFSGSTVVGGLTWAF